MNTQELLAMKRFTRRAALKAAGVGAVGLTLAQSEFLRATAATSPNLQDILNITATVERFGVTYLGAGLQANKDGKYNKAWPDIVVAVVTAARAQEHYHLDLWQKAGGKPLVKTFTVPPAALTAFDTFFKALVEQEAAETASMIAAMSAFTKLKRPDLVKVGFQYGAEESEHRVLANYVLGTRPANDNAFAPAMFATVEDFYADFKKRGLIGGDGTKITYPGPGDLDPTNVTNRTPDGPAATCTVSGVSATPSAATPVS